MSIRAVFPPLPRSRGFRAARRSCAIPPPRTHRPLLFALSLLSMFAVPDARAQSAPDSLPGAREADLWAPKLSEEARERLEEAEEARRALGIIADPAGTTDPCLRSDGPNLVNFVRRGEPGGPTYLFGIDLCSRRPFVYREPTRPGAIVGFDANPPDIQWAEDPSDDRNLRGDRFDVELLGGAEMLFGTSTLDYGETANGSVDFAVAPSIGVRFDRFRVTVARAMLPPERSWLAKVSVMPFRRGPPDEPVRVAAPPPGSRDARTAWSEPVAEVCEAEGVGIRGVDHFRLGHRDEEDRYPVTLDMVSYCTSPYRAYRVRTFTEKAWFGQFNNTFPKFAAWDDVPRGGLLNNLAFTIGYGEVMNDVFNVDFLTTVFYAGLGISFGNSRWRVDVGRLFSDDELDVISAGVPVNITTDGWTVQIQRALHLAFLGS